MMNYFIESFIKKLSYDTFSNYLISQKIILDEKTSIYFFDLLKNNYHDIIKRPSYYLNIIKNNTDINTYQKVYNLYLTYSKKLYH